MSSPASEPSKAVLPPALQLREIAGEITYFVLSLGIGILVTGLYEGIQSVLIGPSQKELSQLLSIFNGPLALTAAWLFYRWMGRHNEKTVVRPQFGIAQPPKPIFESTLDTLLGIVLSVVGSFVIANFFTLLGLEIEEQSKILEIIQTGKVIDLVALSLSALVFAPLVEEGLFRGLFFRRLLERVPAATAYFVSALVFALIHLNPSGILIYSWLGCVFAWTYQRSGRIGCAVLVHAGNNAASLAVQLYIA